MSNTLNAARRTRERCRRAQQRLNKIKLEKGCEVCGYDEYPEALQFAHRDPSTKSRHRGGAVALSWSIERQDEEIAKCRILCANCHAVETKSKGHTKYRRDL